MSQGNRQAGAFSFGPFVWFTGVVEDRMDPEHLGRVRVRIYGYHDPDTSKTPTDKLFWAMPLQSVTSAANSGIGQSPTGMIEGTTVIGFFMDGHAAQTPVILGSLAGKPEKEKQIDGGGFKDPNDKYPNYDDKESDVSRLARGAQEDKTITKKKDDSRSEAPVAFGGKWKEPQSPYKAKYPFNHVRETESGHIQEFDDTEGNERIHTYHRTGTYNEIGPDGTMVTKIVKDNYTITAGDGFILVEGDAKITVNGSADLKVGGDANIQVGGNCKEEIGGDYSLQVNGSMSVRVGSSHSLDVGASQTSTTGGNETRSAALILLN